MADVTDAPATTSVDTGPRLRPSRPTMDVLDELVQSVRNMHVDDKNATAPVRQLPRAIRDHAFFKGKQIQITSVNPLLSDAAVENDITLELPIGIVRLAPDEWCALTLVGTRGDQYCQLRVYSSKTATWTDSCRPSSVAFDGTMSLELPHVSRLAVLAVAVEAERKPFFVVCTTVNLLVFRLTTPSRYGSHVGRYDVSLVMHELLPANHFNVRSVAHWLEEIEGGECVHHVLMVHDNTTTCSLWNNSAYTSIEFPGQESIPWCARFLALPSEDVTPVVTAPHQHGMATCIADSHKQLWFYDYQSAKLVGAYNLAPDPAFELQAMTRHGRTFQSDIREPVYNVYANEHGFACMMGHLNTHIVAPFDNARGEPFMIHMRDDRRVLCASADSSALMLYLMNNEAILLDETGLLRVRFPPSDIMLQTCRDRRMRHLFALPDRIQKSLIRQCPCDLVLLDNNDATQIRLFPEDRQQSPPQLNVTARAMLLDEYCRVRLYCA